MLLKGWVLRVWKIMWKRLSGKMVGAGISQFHSMEAGNVHLWVESSWLQVLPLVRYWMLSCFLSFANVKKGLKIIIVDHSNYSGTSGGMTVAGVRNTFFRSDLNYGIPYKLYLGNDDCKGFETICTEQLYGLKKVVYVGHVQRRMGTGLGYTTTQSYTIQLYYGLSIIKNALKGLYAMKNTIWAEYYHLGSTDEDPCHASCPSNNDTWCKYQVTKIN